jgi:transposase IS116/IS110/IS902 family protein
VGGKLHAVRGPRRRRRGATSSGPRGGPCGSDALPAPAVEAAAAPRDPVRRRARGRTAAAPGWPASIWLAGGADPLLDACGAVDVLVHRREPLERKIVGLLGDSPWQVQIARLRCLRGIDTLTAAGRCAEIADFERFARAEQITSYVGQVARIGTRERLLASWRSTSSTSTSSASCTRRLLSTCSRSCAGAQPDRGAGDRRLRTRRPALSGRSAAAQDRVDLVTQPRALTHQPRGVRDPAPQRARDRIRRPRFRQEVGGAESCASTLPSILSVLSFALAIARVRIGLDTVARPACSASSSAIAHFIAVDSRTTWYQPDRASRTAPPDPHPPSRPPTTNKRQRAKPG